MRLLVLLALLGCRKPVPVEPASEPDAPEVTDPRQVTIDQLNVILDEVMPLVEEEAGRAFQARPPVGLGTPATLAAIVETEARLLLAATYPDLPEEKIHRLAEESRLAVPGIIGKYAVRSKTLYISLDALGATIDSGVFEPEQSRDMVTLVMAHELTHALQGESADFIAQVQGSADMDAMHAMNSVVEGQATWVTARVAARLGLEELDAEMEGLQGWSDEEGPLHPGAYPIWSRYGLGKRFVEAVYQQGGHELVWTMLESPPRSSSMIWRPETYGSEVAEDPELAAKLDGLEALLTKGEWLAYTSTLGETTLREEALGWDQDALGEVLSHLELGHLRSAEMPDRNSEIRVLLFDDAQWPLRYVELLETQNDAAVEAAAEMGMKLTMSVQSYELDAEADKSVLRIIAPEYGVRRERQAVWVARGPLLVVVATEGFRPGIRLDRAVAELFARLDG